MLEDIQNVEELLKV